MSDVFALAIIAAAAVIAIIVWYWVSGGLRVLRQRGRNAFADRLVRDEAPPKGAFAVYLRAFRHPAYVSVDPNLGDQLRTLIVDRHTSADGRNGTRPLEAILAELLDKDMPLVGLGRPASGLIEQGAGLVRTSDAEWKQVVSSMLDRCSVIVMAPAGTAGTAWEIEQLGARPEWCEKTIYFMPNYHVELIRALQPFVVGYETVFGTSRFAQKKPGKPKKAGSLILYGFGVIFAAFPRLFSALFRFVIDLAFGCVLLFQRFALSFGLRSRWARARRIGRVSGLAFPAYSAKGRIFVLNAQGKPHNLATLHDLSRDALKEAILDFARTLERKRAQAARTIAPELMHQPATSPASNAHDTALPARMRDMLGEADAIQLNGDAAPVNAGDTPASETQTPEQRPG